MGITEILRRIWLFFANKIKSLVNNQLNSSLRQIIDSQTLPLTMPFGQINATINLLSLAPFEFYLQIFFEYCDQKLRLNFE